jgi:hypothetical protein
VISPTKIANAISQPSAHDQPPSGRSNHGIFVSSLLVALL